MRILFIHQNFPGQYPHLAAHLAADLANTVVAIGERANMERRAQPAGVRLIGYPSPTAARPEVHPFVRGHESAVRRGHLVAQTMMKLRERGFVPEVVCAHPGWGETLFVKDVYPEARLIGYFEFFYHGIGADVGFDPEFPTSFDDLCRVRVKNSTMLITLDAADAGVAPTRWQQIQAPAAYRSKIEVVHDGIDTVSVCPDPGASLTLGDGRVLTAADEIVTYASRNLEPYRGFHIFMRALPAILARRPQAQVVILGGDQVSYGVAAAGGGSYRERLLAELGDAIDTSRVHFLGRVPYRTYLAVLRISKAHVYLSYPFVLSWSMLEAMAAGCMVIGSNTPPVAEVIENSVNGWLFDFFDHQALAARVCDALADPAALEATRAAARRTVVERYDLKRVCLPRQIALVAGAASGQ